MADVTVVVATHDRARRLDRLLDALAAQQDPPPFEVVVVDDASRDDTGDVLARRAERSDLRLRHRRLDRNRGPAAARNLGLELATARWVAFTDDDCVPTPGWLRALHDVAARGADVVAGSVAPAPDQPRGPFSRTLEVTDDRFLQTANVLYRRELLVRLDGFDEALTTGEDTDLGERARATGALVAFAPEALVHHDVSPSSVRDAVRTATKWVDLPGVVARHPHLRRTHATARWFWKDSHPPLVAGVVGVGLAVAIRRRVPLLACGWWLVHRLVRRPVASRPLDRLRTLPGALAVDAAEVTTMARGSLRHRTLLL